MANAEKNLACLVLKYPIHVYGKIYGNICLFANRELSTSTFDSSFLNMSNDAGRDKMSNQRLDTRICGLPGF